MAGTLFESQVSPFSIGLSLHLSCMSSDTLGVMKL